MDFESDLAQVWCYSHLEEFRIDKFVLFKYFLSPDDCNFRNIEPIFYNATFTKKFESYIKILSYLNEGNIERAKLLILEGSIASYRNHKCSSCIYFKLNICNYRRYSRYEGIY